MNRVGLQTARLPGLVRSVSCDQVTRSTSLVLSSTQNVKLIRSYSVVLPLPAQYVPEPAQLMNRSANPSSNVLDQVKTASNEAGWFEKMKMVLPPPPANGDEYSADYYFGG